VRRPRWPGTQTQSSPGVENEVAVAGSQVRVIADQAYSRVGGVARLADVYLPETGSSRLAVVIWLHGGGWRFGDRHLAPDLLSFARKTSLAVVSIDYRLSDEAKFPAAVEDVKAAVRWVRSVADKFGFDGDRVGLWGSSAGGHLAACAALSRESQFLTSEYAGFSSSVQAVVDGYGPTNFARIDADRVRTTTVGADAESLAIGKVLPAGDPDSFESRFLGGPVMDAPAQVELADPVHYVRGGGPPFLILHGQSDTLIPWSQSKYLFDALNATGDETVLALFEKLGHGFFNHRQLAEEDYGAVTILRSDTSRTKSRWKPDPAANIPLMVASFFQSHLQT
jgi:acetyl esterase/lipase